MHVVSRSIRSALLSHRCFEIEHHGVSDDGLMAHRHTAKQFFEQPRQVKESVRRSSTNPRGWIDVEYTKHRRDWKECYDWGPIKRPDLPQTHELNRTQDGWNVWPSQEFERAQLDFQDAMQRVVTQVRQAALASLGLNPRFLDAAFARERHDGHCRINFYPTCPEEQIQNVSGIGLHEDGGMFTVLYAHDDLPGCQFLKDGEYFTIQPSKGCIVVNAGALLQVFSNDLYKALPHKSHCT